MITIIGDPVPKQRPRFANGHTYTPAKTKDYEALVAEAWKYHSGETYHGAVEITVRAYLKIPKSASKAARKMMEEGERRPTKRPDLDNLLKAVQDGLNGAAYDDDSQIVRAVSEKWYGDPRVEIEVKEVWRNQ